MTLVDGSWFAERLQDRFAPMSEHRLRPLLEPASIALVGASARESSFGLATLRNIANPLATIMSAAMMLRYSLDADAEADRIEAAVGRVLDDGLRTADILPDLPDIGGEYLRRVGTDEMADAVIAALTDGPAVEAGSS